MTEGKIKACKPSHIAKQKQLIVNLSFLEARMISTGEAVIRLLASYGVDTIFGIPGVHTLDFCRGLGEGMPVRHIHARNEMGAGFMADGYARSSGRPGVCLTISGPGVTNTTTPLGQAYADSVPLLLISAEAHSETLGKGNGTLHEVTDLNAVTRPLCAFSECAHRPEDIPDLIERAFSVFTSKRPRPVHIAIPIDILATHIEYDWKPARLPKRITPKESDLQEPAQLLMSSKNPFILVGGGARNADIKTLAEKSGAIVVSSNAGKGIMPESHPLSLGGAICRPEVHSLLKAADLIVAIGTELSETDNYIGRLEFDCPLIRIDIDETRFEDLYNNTHTVLGDAGEAVEILNQMLSDTSPDTTEKHQTVARTLAEIHSSLTVSETKHAAILSAVREAVSPDTMIMGDATQMTYTASFALSVEKPSTWHYAAGYCALGFAFPNAIGAKLASPQTDVLAIAGDGGTMFTVQELVSAAELKLPIPLLLWHNDGYKQIRDDMRDGNVPRIAVDGLAPDFKKLAEAMHCHATQPRSFSGLKEDIQKAFKSDRPTLILVREDSDWLNQETR